MTNSRSVLFAVFASLLLATTPTAVSADPALDVASQHTTDADFTNAQTLANLTVSNDVVKLQAGETTIDDFEDGDVSKWSGDIEISQTANSGTYAGLVDGEGAGSLQEGTLDIASISSGGTNVSWAFRTNDFDANSGLRLRDGGTRGPEVGILNSGEFYYYNGSATVTFGSASSDTYYTIKLADVDFSADTYDIYVDGVKQVDDAEMANDIGLFDTVAVYAGSGTQSFVDDIEKSEDVTSAKYVSPVHDVTDGEEAAVNIATATNVSVDITVQTTSGTVVGSTNGITSTGNKTVALSGYSGDELETVVDVDVTGDNPSFSLADESILFNASDPTGTLQSPADGEELTESSVDFTIDVSDADFGTAQGDSVTATLQLRGPGESSWTDYGTDTATSNSTVTVSEEITTGGEWQYRFRLEDSYGESTTTASRSVFVPAELEVRSALPPHELINDVNLTVRFYEDGGEERVFQQNPTDGTISLAGLPTTSFVVTVRANESHAYRRIVLDSLYEQSTVYLLPNNATSSQIVFQLDDRTGRFDAAETTLYIEAPITRDFNGDGNETTRYVTIAGDTFGGSEQFPVTLENNQRYRLRVENENGETRVLGSYTTAGDAVAVLPLGQVVIDSEVGEGGVAFDAAIREAEDGSRYIRVVYRDPEMATQSLSLEVTNPDTGTTIRANSTMQGPYGRYIETVPLPASANDSQTYLIDWNAERNASVVGGQERVGNVNAFVGDIDVDPAIRGLIGYGAIIGLTGLVIIRSPRVAGVVGVGTAVVVSALGVVSIAPSALGIGGAIAVLAFVGGGGR